MMTKSATVGFKIAEIQQQIIRLEHRNAVLTHKENQKLQQLKKTLQDLYQTYDVDLENWVGKVSGSILQIRKDNIIHAWMQE